MRWGRASTTAEALADRGTAVPRTARGVVAVAYGTSLDDRRTERSGPPTGRRSGYDRVRGPPTARPSGSASRFYSGAVRVAPVIRGGGHWEAGGPAGSGGGPGGPGGPDGGPAGPCGPAGGPAGPGGRRGGPEGPAGSEPEGRARSGSESHPGSEPEGHARSGRERPPGSGHKGRAGSEPESARSEPEGRAGGGPGSARSGPESRAGGGPEGTAGTAGTAGGGYGEPSYGPVDRGGRIGTPWVENATERGGATTMSTALRCAPTRPRRNPRQSRTARVPPQSTMIRASDRTSGGCFVTMR